MADLSSKLDMTLDELITKTAPGRTPPAEDTSPAKSSNIGSSKSSTILPYGNRVRNILERHYDLNRATRAAARGERLPGAGPSRRIGGDPNTRVSGIAQKPVQRTVLPAKGKLISDRPQELYNRGPTILHSLIPPWHPPGAPFGYPALQRLPPSRLSAGDAALLSTELVQKENGDVVVAFKQTEVVVVKGGTGDLILNSGGFRTVSTKAVINAALQPVGIKIEEGVEDGKEEWAVSDGRSYFAPFADGMVVKGAGAISKQALVARGSVILQYLKQRKTNAEKLAKAGAVAPRRRLSEKPKRKRLNKRFPKTEEDSAME